MFKINIQNIMTDDSSVNVKDLISKVVEDTMTQNTGGKRHEWFIR